MSKNTNLNKISEKNQIVLRKTRPLTFISGIIGIGLGVIIVVLSLLLMVETIKNTNTSILAEAFHFSLGFLALLIIVAVAIGIAKVVLGATEIHISFQKNRLYSEHSSLVMSMVVFDVVNLAILVLFLLLFGSTGLMWYGIGMVTLFFICVVLKFVDLMLFKAKIKDVLSYFEEDEDVETNEIEDKE